MSDMILISDDLKRFISAEALDAANATCRKAKEMSARIDALLAYQSESQYVIGKMIDEMLDIEIAVKKAVANVMRLHNEWVAKMSKQDPAQFIFGRENIEKMTRTTCSAIEYSLAKISDNDAQIDALNFKYDTFMNHLQPPVSD